MAIILADFHQMTIIFYHNVLCISILPCTVHEISKPLREYPTTRCGCCGGSVRGLSSPFVLELPLSVIPQPSSKINNGSSPSIVLAIAVVATFAVIPLALAGQVFERPEQGSSVIVTMPADTAFERGLTQHLVAVEFEHDDIHVKRGETVTIPFTINHKSHSFWQWVTVGDFQQNAKNYVHGTYVDVAIHDFSPRSAVLFPNSSTEALMTFSIDPSASEDIVGKSVTLIVGLDTEVAFGGSDLDQPSIILAQGGSITLQVVD